MRIAEANHISHGTVEKYAIYSRALDELGKKDKEIVSKILSGRYKISHNHVLELSKMTPSQIRQFCKQMENSQQPFVPVSDTHLFLPYCLIAIFLRRYR